MNFIGWILLLWVFSGFGADNKGKLSQEPQNLDDYVFVTPSRKTVPIPSRAAQVVMQAQQAQVQQAAAAPRSPLKKPLNPLVRSASFYVEASDSSDDEVVSPTSKPVVPGGPALDGSVLLSPAPGSKPPFSFYTPVDDLGYNPVRIPLPLPEALSPLAIPAAEPQAVVIPLSPPERPVRQPSYSERRSGKKKRMVVCTSGRCCGLGLCSGSRKKENKN